jgi:hypothetical protein
VPGRSPEFYRVSSYHEPKADQSSAPVGKGPDRFNCYECVEPDYHNAGELFQTRDGSIYCKVDMPTMEGEWKGKWMKVM